MIKAIQEGLESPDCNNAKVEQPRLLCIQTNLGHGPVLAWVDKHSPSFYCKFILISGLAISRSGISRVLANSGLASMQCGNSFLGWEAVDLNKIRVMYLLLNLEDLTT